MSGRAIRPLASLPSIVAMLDRVDAGPCDGGGSAVCPHCGAEGRYIYRFLCDDGTRRGAMSGCVQLFARTPESRLVEEAFKRQQEACEGRKRLASWWQAMIDAARALESGGIDVTQYTHSIRTAEHQRQAWLARNGYGRFARRR